MKNLLTGLTIATLLITSGISRAQNSDVRYITDQVRVPLRAGQGNQFRILHRGLPTGTKLILLQDSPDTGWAQVSTSNGQVGWIRRQYLTVDPVAKLLLEQAQSRLQHIESLQGDLGGEVRRLEAANSTLETQLQTAEQQRDQLSKELKEIRSLSSKALTLNKHHQELLHQHELLKQQQAMDQAEIQRLNGSSSHKWYIYGALSVGLGAILAMIAPHFRPRRRNSEWTN